MSEWKTKTLAEFKQGATVVWRAQINKAPDGKQFAGIRKFAIKKDGKEQITKDGISFPYDAGTLPETLDGIINLLTKLKGGKVRVEDVKVDTEKQYYFKSDKHYVKSIKVATDDKQAVIRPTNKREEAQLFTAARTKEIAKQLGDKYKAFVYKESK